MASPIARRRLWPTLLVTLIILARSAPCAAEWRRIDSPNFTVIGDVGARTLRDVAVQFEGFRETLGRLMNEVATISAVPTVVIVFPSDRAFTPFKTLYQGKPVEISGLFIGTEDTNYITVVADGRPEAMRVVFHEYAHLIVANVWRNAPMWISEGFAEFYSTYEVSNDGSEAVIGRPVAEHVLQLQTSQLLKLPELLAADRDSPLYNEQNRRSIFYAQSWALSHLIMHGRSALLRGQPPRRKEVVDYMDAITQGMPPLEAWQRAFGVFDVERELRKYIRSDSFGFVRTKITDKLVAVGAPELLPSADAEAFLAEFLLQQARYDEALARLDAAENLNPGNPRVSATRARVEIAKRSEESAAKRLMSVANTNDWLLAYSAGVAMVEIVERRQEAPTVEQLEFVRLVFATVVKQRGDIPNVNARLASLELRSASGPSTNARAAIERARMRAPGREDYALIHAQILAHQHEYGLARNIVGPLMSAAYPADVREAARELMRYVVQLESREQGSGGGQTSPEASTTNRRGQPTDASSTSPPAQESGPSPIFRELKDGEQRLEGVLERIECRARGAATFHIRTDAGVETVTTPRMTGVEFISYRTDLTGTVTCGPLKSPLPVIATWRFDPLSKDPKTAVALEFPPK